MWKDLTIHEGRKQAGGWRSLFWVVGCDWG